MKNIRVIARLDIKGPNLVKGIHLEGLRVLGDPAKFAEYYYRSGIDELMYVDTVASLYGRNSTLDLVKRTAEKIFVPLCVGGGLRSVEDIYQALRSGADKVSLNTAAIRNPNIVAEAARRFGSSTIVIAIEAIRQTDGEYLAYTENGREHTGLEVVAWAKQVADLGAGEILITSVDREGTGKGFDVELIDQVVSAVSVPVIAHGGAGKCQDVVDAMRRTSADAAVVASILHYDTIKQMRDVEFGVEGNKDFLRSGRTYKNIEPASVGMLKAAMAAAKLSVRR